MSKRSKTVYGGANPFHGGIGKIHAATFDRPSCKRATTIVASAALAALFFQRSALAGTPGTYTDNTSGGLWSTTSNWLNGTVANGQDGVANFGTLTLTANNTVHLDSSRTIGQLTFGDKGNAYSWTLDNNGNSANVLTLSTSVGTPVISVANQSATIGASLAGTQGFTLAGGGILNLTGNSSYTGVTNVSSGTLVLSSSSSTSGSLYTTGLQVELDPTLSTITASSGVISGVSDLSGNNNNATAGYGSVTLSTINGHKAFSFSSSGLAVSSYSATTNPQTVFAVIDPASVSGPSAIFGANDGSGSGGLELRLYSSKLDALNAAVADDGSSSTTVTANALSVVAYSLSSSAASFYINGASAGSGSVPSFSGSGTLTIGYKATNGGPSGSASGEFYTGTMGTILVYNTALTAAQIASVSSYLSSEYAASSTTLGTTEVLLSSSGSNLSLASSTQAVSSLAGVAGSNVYLGSGILTVGSDGTSTVFNGNISDTGTGSVGTGGELVKVGAGTLTLGGSVTNTGGTQVNAGTLLVSGTYATSGPTSVTGGMLSITGTDSDTGSHTVSGGTLSISGTNSTTGNFSIGGSGTLVLSGPSTASGAISFSSGGLLTLAANSTNITGTGSSATSSAIGSPSGLAYADAGTTNVQLLSDTSVTFANSVPTSGTGSGAIINYYVNPLTTATNQTLSLSSTSTNGVGYATYYTTINVLGSNGYTLAIPGSINANTAPLTLNASTGNLSLPGGISSVTTLTVNGAANTSIASITGTGPLLKSGAGILTLTGSNTYTAATTITGGTLSLASTATLPSTSGISIASGATFDISNNSGFALSSSTAILSGSGTINGSYNHSIGVLMPGSSTTVGTLTINGNLTLSGGAVDLTISGSNNSTGGVNDLINVTGGLDLVGNTTLTLSPVSPTLPSGTVWTILTYNSSNSATSLATGSFNVSSSAFTVVPIASTPGKVEIEYLSGAVGIDVWTGSQNTNWDTSTANFVSAGSTSPIAFTNGDAVLFNDSSSSTVNTVNLNTGLLPSAVTVNSNVNNFTFTGGSIAGTATLTKLGTSTLTIGLSNTYSGGTNIAGGTVVLNNTAGYGLGTGNVLIGPGATLVVGDGPSNSDGILAPYTVAYTLVDNGILAYNNSSANQPPPLISGTGALYILSGSIGIGNTNTYSGGTLIAGGTVTAFEATSFGTGTVTGTGGTLVSDYGKNFPNNFNLSGITINAGGQSVSEISGVTLVSANSIVQVDGGSAMIFGNTVNFSNGAVLTINSNGTPSSAAFQSLNVSGGALNVNGNVIVHSGSLAYLTAQTAIGYNGGTWNSATGIFSSSAAADTSHLTALGVIQNTLNQSPSGTAYLTTFEGQPVTATDVLIKYTYYGDANLDGKVDGSDYSLVDNTYQTELSTGKSISGWYNGDFNYDGVVNGSDYTLMDNAFNQQGTQFTAQVGTPTAQVGGASAVPEPASVGMLAMASLGLLSRRTNRRFARTRTVMH
jgi:autotransporter-associated beta strand protein